jgi:flagellar hook-associated protein 3 FlgL
MTISPFSAGSLAARKAGDTFVEMRRQMDDLQRQIATGQKSATYGGLGLERRTSLDSRGKIATLQGYETTIQTGQIRVSVLSKNVERLSQIATQTRNDIIVPKFDIGADGKTTAQRNAENRFKEVVDLLNSDVNGRFIFSGRSSDIEPVEAYETIINGDASRAGAKQIIAERRAANVGADGLGRLGVGTNTGLQQIDVTKDSAIPFGFSISAMTHNLTGSSAPTALSAGTTSGFRLTLGGQPNVGQAINITLTLPNGSTQSFALKARSSLESAADGTFAIGANAAATFTNIDTAIRAKIGELAAGPLASFGAQDGAKNFFTSSVASPPSRVPAPPETATALVAGTPANTVIWYKGEDDGSPDRGTTSLRVDKTQNVGIGARANEPALANLLGQLGILISTSFTNTVPEQKKYDALSNDVLAGLDQSNTQQSLQTMVVEIGTAGAIMKGAKDRHVATRNMLDDVVAGVENASTEEVAASLLALQTKMQASYQTTSILSKLSLVNYL